MILSILVLAFVTLQRLGELILARRNTQRLLDRGAIEFGRAHYPYIVVLHAAWLGGLWYLSWSEPANLVWLALYAVLQGLRAWTLASLGAHWTTRIIVLPGEPLVRRGPYRWLSHPNYLVVAGEIAVLPLVFGEIEYAVVFSILNAAILFVRLRAETAALSGATRTRSEPPSDRSPARPG
jgi:methyltransferase